MTDKPNLTAALAAVQAELPRIAKGETAEVETRTGRKYTYSYADLADVSQVILPLLGKNDLAWITKPTFNEAGKFVLVYKLRHVSGEEEVGEYPLPTGTPQEIGSAITYARRYCLCSVTGVAPDSDDDDAAAASHRRGNEWDNARPAQPSPKARELTDRVGTAVTPESLRAAWDATNAAGKAGEITTGEAEQIKALIKQRGEEIAKPAEPQPVDEPVEDRTAEPAQEPMDADWPAVTPGGNNPT